MHFDLPSRIAVNPDFVLLSADKSKADCLYPDFENLQEASDSERESNEMPGVLRKLQKHKRPKVLLSASKEDPQHFRMVGSTDGCLSLLKRGCGNILCLWKTQLWFVSSFSFLHPVMI
jgi:hypothetical protein